MALLALHRSRARLAVRFASAMCLAAGWAAAYANELAAHDLDGKLLWFKLQFLVLPFIPPAWLWMVCELTGARAWMRRAFWAAVLAVPIANAALVLTVPNAALRSDFRLVVEHGLRRLDGTWGPWAYLQAGAGHAIFLVSMGALFAAWRSGAPLARRQSALLLLASVLPLASDAAFRAGLGPPRAVNLAPFSLLATSLVFAWALLRHRTLDLVLVAREVLLENLPALVLVLDPAERLVQANRMAVERLHLRLPEDLGTHPSRILAAPVETLLARGGAPKGTEVVRLGDGPDAAWYERTITPVRDGRGQSLGSLLLLRDVTERVRAEAAGEDDRVLLEIILNGVAEAIFLHDDQGKLIAVNDPMLDLYRVTREEALSLNLADQLSAPNQDVQTLRYAWASMQPGDVLRFGWKARRPHSGETFDASVFLRCILRDHRKLIVSAVADVSDRVRQEKDALEMERLREERKHARQVELLVRDLHDGIGGITANIGMLAALGEQAREPDAKDVLLRRVGQLASEGNAEVRTLMNTLESRELPWNDLIVEIRRHGAMLLEEHGIVLTLDVTGEPVGKGPGLFAGLSLFRIVREALNNIVKHAAASHAHIELTFAPARLELAVSDNGRGLPADLRPGRGLGNMKARARELGGNLEVHTGTGVLLSLTLPLPLRSAPEGTDARQERRAPGGTAA